MRFVALITLLMAVPLLAEDRAATQKALQAKAEKASVVIHFDQPYAGTNNPKQMLDLYLPKTPKSDKPLPVIVFIHGGGWKNGDRINAGSGPFRFASSGDYAGIAISYRLSGEAKWPAQIYDCKAAIRWVRGNAKKFNLDPDHIGVWGSSAGGHLVSLLGTSGDVKELEGDLGPFATLSSRVTCVVNQCGPEDFKLPLMIDKNGMPIIEDPALIELFGGAMSEHEKEAVAASPVTHVSKDDAAFLTLHGTGDKRVNFKHAERIHAALKAAGVPSILVPITNGGHSFNNPRMPELIQSFFDRNLRGMKVEIAADPLPQVDKQK